NYTPSMCVIPSPSFLSRCAEETEVALDLNATLHALYERARFDLRLNYSQPPTPPLPDEDVRWANEVVQSARGEK
ncbi:MAG: DUF4058 family protein, partial [Chloroflexota bacterium]